MLRQLSTPGQGFIFEMDRHAAWETLGFQRRSRYLCLTSQLSRLVLANLRSSLKTEKFGKRLTVFLSISERLGGDDVVEGRDVQHEAVTSEDSQSCDELLVRYGPA